MFRRKKALQCLLGLALGWMCAWLQGEHHCFLEAPKPRPFVNISERRLLFAGVMTAQKYLETRARAVYETWGRALPGSIAFFSSETSASPMATLPLVALPGVDDSYPPQRKSFLMLYFMYQHFGDQYEWFLRADDDVYVKVDKLEELLRSVDSRKPWFIGQAGRGTPDESGQLSLSSHDNFCMGGPGVLMSRETLRRLAPHLRHCLRRLLTTHEDVELGRCVRRYVKVQCTWAYEMQTILYHNQSGSAAFTGNLKQKEVHSAITMHPVKDHRHMYRIHSYVMGLNIQQLEQEKINLNRDITMMMQQLQHNKSQFNVYENHLGKPLQLNRGHASDVEDVEAFELVLGKSVYPLEQFNPRQKHASALSEGLDDVVTEVMTQLNARSRERGRMIDFRSLLYGYWRVQPLLGIDVILDLLLTYRKYRGRKMTVPVRRHAYLQRSFTELQIREEIYSTVEDTKSSKEKLQLVSLFKKIPLFFNYVSKAPLLQKQITFIVPLSGRFTTFERFMKNYEIICLKSDENTKLIIVLYKDDTDCVKTLKLVEKMRHKYKNSMIIVKFMSGKFSRAVALQNGAEECNDNELMFFVDVDVIFQVEALQRIRFNTHRNKTVYFPIVFSQFDPKIVYNSEFTQERTTKVRNIREMNKYSDILDRKMSFLITNTNGIWRQFGFGVASIYKSDFSALGGFSVRVSGWGLEDVALFDAVVQSRLRITRSPDMGMVHVFHSVQCDNEQVNQTQREMCQGTKIAMLGSSQHLQNYLKNHPEILDEIRKNNPQSGKLNGR